MLTHSGKQRSLPTSNPGTGMRFQNRFNALELRHLLCDANVKTVMSGASEAAVSFPEASRPECIGCKYQLPAAVLDGAISSSERMGAGRLATGSGTFGLRKCCARSTVLRRPISLRL